VPRLNAWSHTSTPPLSSWHAAYLSTGTTLSHLIVYGMKWV